MTHETLLGQAEQHRQEAYTAFDVNDFVTARDFYQQALALYDQVWTRHPDRTLQMRIFYALRNIGICALHLEDYAAARTAYERIFATYERWALLQEEELYLNVLKVYIALHDLEAAVTALHRASDFARLYEPRRQATLLWQLADIATSIQRYDVAGDLFALAYSISERIARGLDYQSKLLTAWGHFEYRHRSREIGHTLRHLALIAAARHLDDWRLNTQEPRRRNDAIFSGRSGFLDTEEKRLDTLRQTLGDFTDDTPQDIQ